MQNKKNNAQDTIVTPEQVDIIKAQNIEKRIEEICDRLERNYNNAMEFQAMPMLVYPADDVAHAIEALKQQPGASAHEMQELKDQMKDLNASMEAHNSDINAIAANIKGTYDVLCSFYRRLDETEKTNEKTSTATVEMQELLKGLSPVADPNQGDLTFFKKIETGFMSWWNSRKGFWWRAGIFCSTLGATILVGLYCYRWSDDAWARRAYDAAVGVGYENPERVYRQARTMFNEKGRKEVKERIRQYETDMQSVTEKEE